MTVPPRPRTSSAGPTVREVRIHGALTDADLHLLQSHLHEVLVQEPDRLVVDLSTCPSVTPAAAQVLRQASERVRPSGGVIELRGANEQTHALLVEHDVLDLLEVTEAKQPVRAMPAH